MTSTNSAEQSWVEDFLLDATDLETLYNYLLEKEKPVGINELLQTVIFQRSAAEKDKLQANLQGDRTIYYPRNTYEVGQELVFPALEFAAGKVTEISTGSNPDLDSFAIIHVAFETLGTKQFATGIEDHTLNDTDASAMLQSDLFLSDPQALLDEYGPVLRRTLESQLSKSEDFLRIKKQWFPKELLVETNIGNLHLAEAVLDMSGGGPLKTDELIPHIDLPSGDPELLEFSLNYALNNDERFDEVGPTGEVLWYLHRMEPEPVIQTPLALIFRHEAEMFDETELTDHLENLVDELADELDYIEDPEVKTDKLRIPVTFHHVVSGTLPLSRNIAHFFPTSRVSPRIRFTIVDGNTGDKYSAWVVREKRYIYGLKEIYEKYVMEAGGFVTIGHGKQPGEVIVTVAKRKTGAEYVSTAYIKENKLVVQNERQRLSVKHMEELVMATPDRAGILDLAKKYKDQSRSYKQVVLDVFRALAAMNPQKHVHAMTLYSAVNMLRRTPAQPLFAELMERPYFQHVGDSYWIHNPKAQEDAQ